ncbi:hypothetical protein F2Q70_00011831 [Brassica cretica]|uniref:Uncharacterized protein n=2 Tax=Brassica cretica TaxID=69181 RepID=A0A3N6RL69_BRACR|nr:hypothetical protein F2Q68_00004879 [Brassica cretica]KAF2613374.1 hypothetical protein F2Q70_00011831 [Brassica cretica]KAF3543443.1 hypothetical protein DY000_02007313 [Brassica cretica]
MMTPREDLVHHPPSSIDIRPKPSSTGPKWLRKKRWPCTTSIDIADILRMANGADNLFIQQHTVDRPWILPIISHDL